MSPLLKRSAKLLGIALLCVACVGYGFLIHRNKIFPYHELRRVVYWSAWHRVNPVRSFGQARMPGAATADPTLTALPYLSGYLEAGTHSGGVTLLPERVEPGLNLYTSGHDTAAYLIDMEGNTVHEWSLGSLKAWDRHGPPASAKLIYPEWGYWRRAFAYPDGGLLVIYESAGLLKLDADSNVVWSFWGGCHHDLFVTPEGEIYVLGKERADATSVGLGKNVIDDRIFVLDGDGAVKRSVSLLDAFRTSPYAPLLDLASREDDDIFHSNTVQVLDGSLEKMNPAFRKGNVLTSIRSMNTVAIVDLDAGQVVWALTGRFRWQHEPLLLPGGDMLLFNNKLTASRSQVLQMDPLTQEVRWSYEPPDFFSEILGALQRLDNGNTLITESTRGRALEVTPEGEVAWEFHSPHRAGERDELVATLFELVRYPPDYFRLR